MNTSKKLSQTKLSQTTNTNKRLFTRPVASILLAGTIIAGFTSAEAAKHDAELQQIQRAWAQAVYKTSNKQAKYAALQKLTNESGTLASQYANTPAVLVWDGIVNSTFAAVKGGLGALGLVKKSRDQLERAKQLDPNVLNGSAYTSLGTLYAKVPGWPIAFGDDKKAELHFRKALQINPNGIDPNFFYAEFLAEQGQKAKAIQHLQKALKAAPRPGRPVADAGRRQEASQLLHKLRQEG